MIDASALLELLLNTPRAAELGHRVFANNETLHAPCLIDLEVVQVLRRHAQGGALSPARAQQSLDQLAAFPLERYTHETLLPRIWQLRDSISAYDASYIALAEALEMPLVTCDVKLARARGHVAKIELFA